MMRKLLALFMVLALGLPLPAVAAAADDQKNSATATAEKKKDDKKAKKNEVDEIGSRDVGKGMNWYSLEKEIAIGKALAQQVEAQSKMVDDPVINEYINRVGQNVVRNSDARVPFTIKIIDDDSINAFALPGGFFFVNSGLVLEADEEAELAGVMAHEIAHVAARHGTRQATRGELANLLTIPLIFMGGGIGFGARQAAGLLVPMTFMKFSRNFEREADHLGLQYMFKTGYDPQAFVTFFEKIQAKEKKRPGTLAKAFSSHPQTPDRIEMSQKEIALALPGRAEHIVTTSEFDEVKGRLQMVMNRRKVEDRKGDRPTLRKTSTADAKPVEEKSKDKEGKGEEEDRRPTLKRRDQ